MGGILHRVLGVYAFREFTCQSWKKFSADRLSTHDVGVDFHLSLSVVTITLKRSKNNPFAGGTKLYLGATGLPLCPVLALLGYLAIRCSCRGTLFLFEKVSTLSKLKLGHCLRKAMMDVGVDTLCFSGHSF